MAVQCRNCDFDNPSNMRFCGNCGQRLTCPYHAWSYDLTGKLAGVPHQKAFDGFSRADHGLIPVEHEVCLGFVFIRLEGGLPSVREMLGRLAKSFWARAANSLFFDSASCARRAGSSSCSTSMSRIGPLSRNAPRLPLPKGRRS